MSWDSKISRFLERLIHDKHLHGLWLNTLSFLEYMGSRKIAKALPQEKFNEVLLKHLSEEVRHSLYFKKQAHRVSSQNYGFHKQELLAGAEARIYFQNLDEKSKELAKGHIFLNYLLTTWIIEKRAVQVYTLYSQILHKSQSPFSLKPVLQEEKEHLCFMESHIQRLSAKEEPLLKTLTCFEATEFKVFFGGLEKEAEKNLQATSICAVRA